MVNLKKEIKSSDNLLYIIDSIDYKKEMLKIPKSLSKGSICYVTTNKTFDSLKELFKKKKIPLDNIVFIDAISKSLKSTSDFGDSVYYISSPGALTELDLTISKFLRHNFDYLIFDSITTLNIYNKTPICSKFMSSLIRKIKKSNTKAIFYALGDEKNELISNIAPLVDSIVDSKTKKKGKR